jgi:hypothetical protein
MSDWEHLLCNTCWAKGSVPLGPHHLLLRYPWRPCCECGTLTNSGIMAHLAPAFVKCNNEGPVHELEELVAA